MENRDPRKDPRPGDITENVDGIVFNVLSVENGRVDYTMTDNGHVDADWCPLEMWVETSSSLDKVIHAVPN